MAGTSGLTYDELLAKAFDALTSGETDDAILLCEEARAIKPDGIEALFLLGFSAYLMKDFGRAITIMEGGHQLSPNCKEFADFLSALYSRVGKLSDSLFYSKLGLTLESDASIQRFMPSGFDDFAQNMERAGLSPHFVDASVLYHSREYRKAVDACERELAINPENFECLELLGRALTQVHEYDRAIEVLIQSVDLAPEREEGWQSLGDVLLASGRPEEARKIYHRILEFSPDSIEARTCMAQAMAYCEDDIWAGYPQLVTDIGKTLSASVTATKQHAALPSDGVVHVGFLINEQTVSDKSEILIGLFNDLNDERYKIFAYQQYTQPHPATVRLKDAVHHWRRSYDIDDVTLRTIMQNDGIDVLVDTCGLMSGHRQELLAARPAPFQISWLGFPVGAPAATTDVLISCDEIASADKHDAPDVNCISLGTSLYGYPGGSLVLSQDSAIAPVEQNGFVSFGAFLDMPRLAGSVPMWSEVLKRVENARLVLGGVVDQEGFKPLVQAAFAGTGVEDRVFVQGESDGISERSHLLAEVDILLDTCFVNGTGEICDALWMGVPVVTLMGQRRTARLGGATLQAAGFSSWVASTADEYVEIAQSLARDPQKLSELRASIRADLEKSPLMDAGAFISAMEQAIEAVISQS